MDRMYACFLFGVVVLLAEAQNQLANAAACNARDPDLLELDVDYRELSDSNFTIIPPAVVESGDIVIVAPDIFDGTGGIAASFWHTENRRIADGFQATFEWRYEGNSDGVAFIVQNDRTEDIEGDMGPGMGYLDGLNRYVAVSIDICPQLGRERRYPCSSDSDVVVTATGQAASPAPVLKFGEATLPRSLFPRDSVIKVDIFYVSSENKVLVFNDRNGDTPILEVDATGISNIEDHFGSRFGTFGFSSSNGNLAEDAGEIRVTRFSLRKYISEVRLSSETLAVTPQNLELGSQAKIDIVVVDECNSPSAVKAQEQNISLPGITAYLEGQSPIGTTRVLPLSLLPDGAGKFSVVFSMPENIEANWVLYAFVDTSDGLVAVQGVPLAAVTTRAPSFELPLYAIIIMASVAGLLGLVLVFSVYRVYRDRRRLKQSAELIGYGKEKAKIEELDRAVTYTMSPLMGSLEDIEGKLAKNKAILEAMRSGDDVEDSVDVAMSKLKKSNAALRKELNKLKVQEQRMDTIGGRRTMMKRKKAYERRASQIKQEFPQGKA